MALVRITQGRASRVPGTQVGVQLNTFGLDEVRGRVTGRELAVILIDSAQPMLSDAFENWPKKTGASSESIELMIVEENEHSARIVLQAGGQTLENDPRNKSGIDYAPFLEFGTNGRPAHGALRNAVYDGETEFKSLVRDGVRALLVGRR